MTNALRVVDVIRASAPGEPHSHRYTCCLCKQYCHSMKGETAVVHLVRHHGFGWIGAERAVEEAKSVHDEAMAQPAGKALLDVFGD